MAISSGHAIIRIYLLTRLGGSNVSTSTMFTIIFFLAAPCFSKLQFWLSALPIPKTQLARKWTKLQSRALGALLESLHALAMLWIANQPQRTLQPELLRLCTERLQHCRGLCVTYSRCQHQNRRVLLQSMRSSWPKQDRIAHLSHKRFPHYQSTTRLLTQRVCDSC